MIRYAVGVDLGGTNLKLALVTNDGQVVLKNEIKLKQKLPWYVMRQIGKGVHELVNESAREIVGVACGLPGIVNSD